MSNEHEQDGWLDGQAELWGQPQAQDQEQEQRLGKGLHREYERRHRLGGLMYRVGLACSVGSIAGALWAAKRMWEQGRPMLFVGLTLLYVPIGLYLGWRHHFFWSLKRQIYNFTTTQSLAHLERELKVSQREQRWLERCYPFLMAYVSFFALSVLWNKRNLLAMLMVLFVGGGAMALAYVVYVRFAQALRERAQRLAQLKADLEQ